MNPDGNVLLTYYCDNSNIIINGQMVYFSGTSNGMPTATTIVAGPDTPFFGEILPSCNLGTARSQR